MNYIKGFDGLRAISILFVVITHLGIFQLLEEGSFLKNNYLLFSGTSGVMIFFVISGFLITTLLLKEKEKFGHINFKFFFIRRFMRLLPPLILFFIAIFVLMFTGQIKTDYIALLLSFFYVYNFVPYEFLVAELAHTWSLAVEEQFYLMWPFVIYRLKVIKKIMVFAITLIIVCFVARILVDLPIVYNGKTYFLENYTYIKRWFIPAAMPIMIGSLTAILWFKNAALFQKQLSNKWYIPLLALALYCIQLVIPGVSLYIIHLMQPIGVALLLQWMCYNQQTLLVKIFDWAPIAFIGRISYGIYVFQGLFLLTGPGGKLAIQQYPLNIILTLGVSVASYYLVEKPVMRYKNRFKPGVVLAKAE
jgi:peptidoglycan/LPS O-acetylase OafA/YrhL